MAKKKNNKAENQQKGEQNPEIEERNRLKSLAHTNNILSQTQSKHFSPLLPSKTVIKHHGKDIVKKSHRKNRYLFSFDGLIAPVSGGKIGELTQLGSKNPVLYLEFPQGRMKLLGTIVYPKNRYLTLQFSRGGKNVMCEDCFDNMVVFSEAYWVGTKDENPGEERLDFPKELYESKPSECDFQGGAGAGAAATQNKTVRKPSAISVEEESISDELVDDMETESPEREDVPKDIEYTTPVRQSERTAGKKFKFTEASSGDDSAEIDGELGVEANEEASDEEEINQNPEINETAVKSHDSEGFQVPAVKVPPSSKSNSGENKSSRVSLVQPTISTLFKKVEQKSTVEDAVMVDSSKAPKKSAQKNISKSKTKSVTIQVIPDSVELPKDDNVSQVKKPRAKPDRKKQKAEAVEVEDDIEDVSSASEEGDDSDDDWRT
ncbi:hypothetical protein RND81_08G014200 [Saponaria officinalis]|uniref:DNA-binding protein RHL1 n=1 Tax=Saponaria officinalis TaxID=3572 RepID=A0AAW1J221_SAPOF